MASFSHFLMFFASLYCLTSDISFMALFFTKNLYFKRKNSFMKTFLLSSYFHTHPITLFLEILGRRMHGPSPHLKFLAGRPPAPRYVSAHGFSIQKLYCSNNTYTVIAFALYIRLCQCVRHVSMCHVSNVSICHVSMCHLID